ncbi:MAG: cytidine deaminase [Sphingopyxis sp.]
MTSRDDLFTAARAAARGAHAPYSHFGVGAALLLDDGRIVTGCNFENASYGLTLCAETVALATANSMGDLRRVVAVAVIGGALGADGSLSGSDAVRPCGRCRQMLYEAASMAKRDIAVHCSSADGTVVETHALSALLPFAFGPHDLGII